MTSRSPWTIRTRVVVVASRVFSPSARVFFSSGRGSEWVFGRPCDETEVTRLYVYQTQIPSNIREHFVRMPKYIRTRWTSEQLDALQRSYDVNPFPTKEERASLAKLLCVTQRNVQVWFQNTRQRGKVPPPRPSPPPPHRTSSTSLPMTIPAVHGSVVEDIRLLATSIDVGDDAFDEEHVSSISMLVNADPLYVRCVMEESGTLPP